MNFVKLTPLGAADGEAIDFYLNAELIVSIQRVESQIRGKSRTVITTTNGVSHAVQDAPEDIFNAIAVATGETTNVAAESTNPDINYTEAGKAAAADRPALAEFLHAFAADPANAAVLKSAGIDMANPANKALDAEALFAKLAHQTARLQGGKLTPVLVGIFGEDDANRAFAALKGLGRKGGK